ncbi:MAG: FAD-dependent monooxygenase [Rhodocyclaceae bacterium]|nr:FAD-dependent monooxygenase [Rhodocyclaceae bacterium]
MPDAGRPLAADTGPVAIVGGGPAGMALALALHRQGVASAIVDARARGAASADKRILALSHGSRLILEWLGVWREIPHTAIATIDVSHQGGLGRTRLSAREENVPALGYVLAAGALAASLDAALARAGIAFHDKTHVAADAKPGAPLVVWAEGAVDAADAVSRDYGQHAVICTATTRQPHGGMAWERFTPAGPVAVLPFGDDVAVVLTAQAPAAAAIAAGDERAFLDLLQARCGRRLAFTAATARHVFPLGLRYRTQPVGAREVWIGNAAQTLHPVGGQGFNLALRDIFELARCLADAADPGAPATLARYAAARRTDRRAAIGFTDSLVRVFSNDNRFMLHARGAGLLALDLLPPLRSFLARRMMFGARAW